MRGSLAFYLEKLALALPYPEDHVHATKGAQYAHVLITTALGRPQFTFRRDVANAQECSSPPSTR